MQIGTRLYVRKHDIHKTKERKVTTLYIDKNGKLQNDENIPLISDYKLFILMSTRTNVPLIYILNIIFN